MYEELPRNASEAEAALCQMISDRLHRGIELFADVDDDIGLEPGTTAEMVRAYGVVRRSPGVASTPTPVDRPQGNADAVLQLLDVL